MRTHNGINVMYKSQNKAQNIRVEFCWNTLSSTIENCINITTTIVQHGIE